MGKHLRLFAATVLLFAGLAHAGDSSRANVVHYPQHSAVTAHVRIDCVETVEEFRDVATGKVGYRKFKVTATVIEGFRGAEPGEIEFLVTQEQPSTPPADGTYIVSLDRDEQGRLVFADDSVLWVAATPDLLAAARLGR